MVEEHGECFEFKVGPILKFACCGCSSLTFILFNYHKMLENSEGATRTATDDVRKRICEEGSLSGGGV